MATSIITTSTNVTGTNLTLGAGVNLLLLSGVYRVSSAGTAILAENATHDITLLGTVFGDLEGLHLGTSSSLAVNTDVIVGQGAELLSRVTGIESLGAGLSIHNEGLIKGGAAIDHAGNFFTLVNLGSIVGTDAYAVSASGTASSIVNYGTIQVISRFGYAIDLASSDGASATIENFGTIAGVAAAIDGATNEADTVLNHGRILGNILLNGGDDVYDGHDGTVTGVIFGGSGLDTVIGGAGREVVFGDQGDDTLEGGAGNDVLNGGAGADTIDGGEGDDLIRPGADADLIDGGAGLRDVLDYSLGIGPVTINLGTGDADGGDATGDVFSGIEGVIGTVGLDVLIGDALANNLQGGGSSDLLNGAGGNDWLSGGTGVDTLIGGLGVDVLRGGENGDIFRFVLPADSGAPGAVRDRILDFSKAELDRIDLSLIDANATVVGNEAFTFTTGASFSAAGQVRAQVIGGNTYVFANTDAVLATVEFSVVLVGAVSLAAADFIL